MNRSTHQRLARRKRRVRRRLERARRRRADSGSPVLSAGNVRYEVADRAKGISCGGLGAIHLLARRVGLVEAIDRELHLLKAHLPYHESDHALAVAYNLLAGGECLEDLELLRTDEGVLDALGAESLPDPTTAGDFCRRFTESDVRGLMDAVNGVRVKVWQQQPAGFFDLAVVDADGTVAPTRGECKGGIGYSYTKQWGYHPLVVSLANTREPLYLVNRPGNRPSYEGAAEYLDRAIDLCRGAGFRKVLLRGDTDFSQTAYLDGWDGGGVWFCFGIDAMKNLVALASALPASAWRALERPAKYEVKTRGRSKPPRVKEGIVREAGWKNVTTAGEDVAEFAYTPVACGRAYRMVVLRKNLSVLRVLKGEAVLSDDVRYFFFVTNLPAGQYPAGEVVLCANGRCDQENLVQQLKAGVKAMRMPAHDLVSNWAYMVMASLAWTLKAWAGLLLPVHPGHRQRHEGQRRDVIGMEFKRFCNALVRIPCLVVRTGRRVVYRILCCTASDWPGVLLRAAQAWRKPLPTPTPLRC